MYRRINPFVDRKFHFPFKCINFGIYIYIYNGDKKLYWCRNASFNSSLIRWRKLITLLYAMVSSLLTHLSVGSSFNFQKYIQRSLEDDFKIIVGIRY
ncbi:hypothetical protein Goarm_023425 [Gossypium armourianum]|uniref:Uncharacterized protein n=1 Tax=Gossypium armourianum TaxID=34283 RepID=A0A7J9KFZ0_9ROSI|nr:hypothetical protein [Gossypium armourianum]